MRTMMLKTLLLVSIVSGAALGGCGPAHRGDDDGNGSGSGSGSNSCPTCATVTGKVWAPKWSPGAVPPGQEIPIYGALVYATATRPAPIPDHVYCESCVDAPAGSVASGHDGSFSLTVLPGHYWLVIQKGQFRLEQELDIAVGTTTLAPQNTTLPSKMDGANGAWIPRIAIARGNYDAVEDILGKIGFGSMSGDKLGSPVGENSFPEITFYTYATTGNTSVTYLLQHVDEMRKYHIIFFPCSTEVDDAVLADQTTLKNIRQFVAEGGKIYVTDWSGETADRAFPPQLTLGGGGFGGTTDSVGTYDPTALTGTLTTAGDADGSLYTSTDAKAVDPDLNAWLGLQIGPSQDNPTPHMYTPDAFTVEDNWNWIQKLNSVMKGADAMGNQSTTIRRRGCRAPMTPATACTRSRSPTSRPAAARCCTRRSRPRARRRASRTWASCRRSASSCSSSWRSAPARRTRSFSDAERHGSRGSSRGSDDDHALTAARPDSLPQGPPMRALRRFGRANSRRVIANAVSSGHAKGGPPCVSSGSLRVCFSS